MRPISGRRHHLSVLAKLSRRVAAGAFGLFALLLSHQVIWTALREVSANVTPMRLWIQAGESLLPTGDPRFWEHQIQADTSTLRLEIISAPESRLQIVQNGSRLAAERRLGRTRLELPLRQGLNHLSVLVDASEDSDGDRREARHVRILSVPSVPGESAPMAFQPFRIASSAVNSFTIDSALVTAIGTPAVNSGSLGDLTRGDDLLGTFVERVDRDHRWSTLVRFVDDATSKREERGLADGVPRDTIITSGPFAYVDGLSPLARKVSVRIEDGALHIRAVVDGRFAPLRQRLETLAGSEFLHAVFGLCIESPDNRNSDNADGGLLDSLRCGALRPQPNDWRAELANESFTLTRDLQLPPGQVHVHINPTTPLAHTFPRLPGDLLTVEDVKSDDDATVQPVAPGYRRDGNTLVWDAASSSGERADTALVTITRPAAATASPDAPTVDPADEKDAELERADRSLLITRIRELEQQWVPLNVRPLLNSLLSALPFFYLLWLLHAYPPTFAGHAATLKAVIVSFLVLHLSIVAVSFFRAEFAHSWLMLLDQPIDDSVWGHGIRLLRSSSLIYPFLAIGIVLLVKPVFGAVRRQARHNTRPLHPALTAACWGLFWLGTVAIPPAIIVLLAQVPGPAPQGFLPLLAALGTGFLTLWFLLFWVFRGVLRIPVKPQHAMAASWAMLVLPAAPLAVDGANEMSRRLVANYMHVYPLMLPERTNTYVTLAIIVALGAILLWQTGTLTMLLSQNRPSYRWWRRHRPFIMVAALVMAIPIGARDDVLFSFLSLVSEIDSLLPYAMLVAALVMVHLYNPRDRFDLPLPVLHVGAMVFAWYVVQIRATLLFIPVSFVAGWWLFRRWLIARPVAVAPVSPTLLGAYLEERRARARLESLQRGLDKKFGEGELTFAAFGERLNEGQQSLAAATQALQAAGGQDVRVFQGGAEATPSQNAAVAVKYGMVLSAPYQLFTLGEMFKDVNSQYPLLAFTFALLYSVTTWVVTSAVFGYFYHALRGRTGFEKAVSFSACVVLPTIPIRLMFGQNLIDPEQVLDVVRVVGFILVLALLAFDLRTLQKHKYGWRELMTVYGLASVAYGSTIVVALASAIGGSDVLVRLWSWFAS